MHAKGRVKWFSNTKGWGFIETDGHGDVFVHYSAIEGEGFRRLDAGDEVEFELTHGEKGLTALNVRYVGGPPNGGAKPGGGATG
jgi:CspA family cold shock protein